MTIKPEVLEEVERLFIAGESAASIAEQTGVARGSIYNLSYRNGWKAKRKIHRKLDTVQEALDYLSEAIRQRVDVSTNLLLLEYAPFREIEDLLLEAEEQEGQCSN